MTKSLQNLFVFLTLLLARAKAISCFVSDSGTPSAIIATTLIVGCIRADMEEAAALHSQQKHRIKKTNIFSSTEQDKDH